MNPRHETLQNAGIVAAGGAIGTALRIWVQAIPFPPGAQLAMLAAINIVGSFALGYVLMTTISHTPSRRLFIGTGILGGFTTYSAFTLEAFTGFAGGAITKTLVFISISLIGGLSGAVLGARLGRRV